MQSLRKLLPRRVAVESRSALASSRALLAGPRFWTSTAARVDGSPKPQVHLVCLTSPLVPYSAPLQWMLDLVAAKARKVDPEPKDYLFIVQHAPVYTLGKRASHEHVKFDLGTGCPHEVHFLERGGEVTYHGPGQLTLYPVLNLNNFKRDLHWYVNVLEQVVVDVAARHGIAAGRDPANPGVWVGTNKVAAIGVKVSRWVTMHGVGLNVTPHVARGFDRILACGIDGRGVTDIITAAAAGEGSVAPQGYGTGPAGDAELPDAASARVIERVAEEVVEAFESCLDCVVVRGAVEERFQVR